FRIFTYRYFRCSFFLFFVHAFLFKTPTSTMERRGLNSGPATRRHGRRSSSEAPSGAARPHLARNPTPIKSSFLGLLPASGNASAPNSENGGSNSSGVARRAFLHLAFRHTFWCSTLRSIGPSQTCIACARSCRNSP